MGAGPLLSQPSESARASRTFAGNETCRSTSREPLLIVPWICRTERPLRFGFAGSAPLGGAGSPCKMFAARWYAAAFGIGCCCCAWARNAPIETPNIHALLIALAPNSIR